MTKVTDPAVDDGLFDLFINATEHATDVADAGSTGAQFATIGANTFAEAAGTDTSLGDYISVVSGAGCGGTATAGTITLAAGENKTCTITNTRRPRVTKVTDPAVDDGLFDVRRDATDVADAGSTGAQRHHRRQHVRRGGRHRHEPWRLHQRRQRGGLRRHRHGRHDHPGGRREQDLHDHQHPAGHDGDQGHRPTGTTNVGDTGSTGAQFATIGANTFAEAAGTGTSLGDYISVVSGAGCGGTATAGTITLAAGDDKTCTITNIRKARLILIKNVVGATGPGAVTASAFTLIVSPSGGGPSVASGPGTAAPGVTVVLNPGGYVVTESGPAGFIGQFTGDCDPNGNVSLAPGDVKTCTITNVPASAVTDTSFCPLDTGGVDGRFRLTYVLDPQDMSYRLNSSNPGQFYYNVFADGGATNPVALSIQIPYPFVTQGANSIQVHSMVVDNNGCFGPSGDDLTSQFTVAVTEAGGGTSTDVSPSGAPVIVLGDYGGSPSVGTTQVTVNVDGTVPPSNLVYVTIHLDYGLKRTTGWEPGALDSPKPANNGALGVTIADPESYSFMVSGDVIDTQTATSENNFKKDPGFIGVVTFAGEPVSGVTVEIRDSENNPLGSVLTDENGIYFFYYKHKGKKAEFTVTAVGFWSETVLLKSNKWAIINFEVDSP